MMQRTCATENQQRAEKAAALRRLRRAQVVEARRIRDVVADCYTVTPAQLRAPCRHRSVAAPRQVAMYLMRADLHWPTVTRNAPFPMVRIGRLFGGRDHSTVAHDVAAIATRLHTDVHLHWMLRTIRAMLDATHEDGRSAA
jgi:chromosomal replication initiator protein